jgi:hypothetical protein
MVGHDLVGNFSADDQPLNVVSRKMSAPQQAAICAWFATLRSPPWLQSDVGAQSRPGMAAVGAEVLLEALLHPEPVD